MADAGSSLHAPIEVGFDVHGRSPAPSSILTVLTA
jgi:hypothetical protein